MRVIICFFCLAASLLSGSVHAEQDPVAGMEPVRDSDFYADGQFSEAQVRLGQLLFFDKILSGNKTHVHMYLALPKRSGI